MHFICNVVCNIVTNGLLMMGFHSCKLVFGSWKRPTISKNILPFHQQQPSLCDWVKCTKMDIFRVFQCYDVWQVIRTEDGGPNVSWQNNNVNLIKNQNAYHGIKPIV